MLATDDYKQIDREIERERSRAVDVFNRAYARWLVAKAKVMGPLPKAVGERGKRYEAYVTKIDHAYDALIELLSRTPAVFKYQVARKFEILYELLDDDEVERARLLAQSIQDDMRGLGKHAPEVEQWQASAKTKDAPKPLTVTHPPAVGESSPALAAVPLGGSGAQNTRTKFSKRHTGESLQKRSPKAGHEY